MLVQQIINVLHVIDHTLPFPCYVPHSPSLRGAALNGIIDQLKYMKLKEGVEAAD